MILKKVTVANFLSIQGSIEFDLDSKATILLGANDHGKSNILRALRCLNEDVPIEASDVNWDAIEPASVKFKFELSASEMNQIVAAAQKGLQSRAMDKDEDEDEDEESEEQQGSVDADEYLSSIGITVADEKPTVEFSREGADGPLCVGGMPLQKLPNELDDLIARLIPRVELFSASAGELQDSVRASELQTEQFEFLQGVFFYAGIDPLESETTALFSQDDRTERRLDDASKVLDRELRQLWAQGTDLDLHFELRHRGGSIEFLAIDPAVRNRKARMSKRSAGVTQFFRLSMTLHARRMKHPANSYLYLFDEPGVFLHPKGQKDLIQVFEQLSSDSQIVYATHSLFMLNQNFPERHRLITRDAGGTKVDQKPYRANWRLAADALGVHLTANILFSPTVLLVEGDSEPLYIYELFRQLNGAKRIDADANMLGVLSYNADLPNLRYLLQTFKDGGRSTKVVALYDGDTTGRRLRTATKELCERLEVPQLDIGTGSSIENFILFPDEFVSAVDETIREAARVEQTALPDDLSDQIKVRWDTHNSDQNNLTRGNWFKTVSKHFLGGQEASKVALARNYAFKCRESGQTPPANAALEQAVALCASIIVKLDLPSIEAKQVIETR